MPYDPTLTDDQQTCDTVEVEAHYRGSVDTPDYTSPETYRADLPLSTCISAHSGISHSPERRGASEVQGWCEGMASDYRSLLEHATTPEKVETLNQMWETYRTKLRTLKLAQLRSLGQVVSTMIAGPANFPVRRMEKRNASERKRSDEYLDYAKAGRERIIKALHPELRPIMTGDADALERLTQEVAELEARQQHMKMVNAFIRKNLKKPQADKIQVLVAAGISESEAAELVRPGGPQGMGYPQYKLTNNNANIRRIQKRIEHIKNLRTLQAKVEQVPQDDLTGPTGIRIELAPGENRVRLHFPGKPDAATIQDLKRSGFRWAPSQGAWSAYFKTWTVAKAKQLAGLLPQPQGKP